MTGQYVAKTPAGDKGQGVYIFRAAYKDHGANGLPGIPTEESFTLRNPNVNPQDYNEFADVNKMAFNGTKFVIPSKSGSYIALKDIDLTGLSQVEFMAMAPKAQLNALGGFIEVRADAPTGKLLGKSDFIGDTGGGFMGKPVVVGLQPMEGMHSLYVVFTNPDPKASGALMIVMNTTFKGEDSNGAGQAAPVATDLNAYAGKYKMTGLPFEYIAISVKDEKLMIDAGGQVGALTQTGEDTFDAGGQAKITFIRDANVVSKMKMDAMGFSFEGVKE